MKTLSATVKILGTLALVFTAAIGIVFLASIQVSAGNTKSYIDVEISVTPNKLPFGTVFPEEVLLKPITLSLSESYKTGGKVEEVEYSIIQKAKPKKSWDKAYCENNPNDTIRCYPSLCPYLSKTPDNSPANDTGVPAFHDPSLPSSIAHGVLNQKTDDEDKWILDLHVPCFKGECAQDNIVPKEYEADPNLEGKQFACDLSLVIDKVTYPFKEKEGTIGFWKNWKSNKTYTENQINGWLGTINADSGWLVSESGYSVNTTGVVSLINDSNSCNGSQRTCAKKKFLAQYIAARLNVLSGRKVLTGTYTLNSNQRTYLGISTNAPLSLIFTNTEGKLPDGGTIPTRDQFLLLSGSFDTINNTGI